MIIERTKKVLEIEGVTVALSIKGFDRVNE